ncbi:PREDICTED: uncharacterized protein LOC104826691 [Tarenaya hassleriana]|uniref:uncharacterized protein LOC104826691 n=1 Tax=Tarenaya hassleriana TaxID=28532 RepID=UPI00053C751D|nr:PREDICTED: uncharacterized protein LOC104826691 [Tarenaya hassleriana]
MLRAMSTRRNHGGYQKLVEEEEKDSGFGQKLKRVGSVPSSFYGPSINPKQSGQSSQLKKSTGTTVHPLLSFFDVTFQRKQSKNKNKKKTVTSKPEMARYLEYLKEGGVWDPTSNSPVIYFR